MRQFWTILLAWVLLGGVLSVGAQEFRLDPAAGVPVVPGGAAVEKPQEAHADAEIDAASPTIFREYSYTQRWGEPDPGATHPMQRNWSRRQPRTLDNVDLVHAVRAEMSIEYWGGHIGTSEQRFQVNGQGWIDIPQPEHTPDSPIFYHRTLLGNPPVEVPVAQLRQGQNVFVFAAGPQLPNGNFGFYWVYAFTLRVFYTEEVPHPVGEIAFPLRGGVLGDDPVLAVALRGGHEHIARVDFIGYYEDFDWEGNGRFQDWHYQLVQGVLTRHLGTAEEPPFVISWENRWVPDQPAGMRIKARITDTAGVVYETPQVDGVQVWRPDRSVKLYPASKLPQRFGTYRAQRGECTIPVGDSLGALRAATLALSTWSGGELSEIGLNGRKIAGRIGLVNNYSHDLIPVPAELIQAGDNRFHVFSFADYHKVEINWPGPALLLEFAVDDPQRRATVEQSMLQALDSKVAEARAYAARELGRMRSKAAVSPLLGALTDDRWEVRAAAAQALGEIGDSVSTGPLITVLRTEAPYTADIWQVRRNAAEALSKMRGAEAEALLLEAADDPDRLLQGYARYALECLRGDPQP